MLTQGRHCTGKWLAGHNLFDYTNECAMQTVHTHHTSESAYCILTYRHVRITHHMNTKYLYTGTMVPLLSLLVANIELARLHIESETLVQIPLWKIQWFSTRSVHFTVNIGNHTPNQSNSIHVPSCVVAKTQQISLNRSKILEIVPNNL